MPIPAYIDSIAGGLIACQALEMVDGRVRVRVTAPRAKALGFSRFETFSQSQIVPRDCVRRGRWIAPYSWADRFTR